MAKRLIEFKNFRGVVNTKNPFFLTPEELVNCTNFYVTRRRTLKTRGGLTRLGELSFKNFTSIGYFSKTGKLYLVTDSQEFYEFDLTAQTFTLIGSLEGTRAEFLEAFGRLWIADGGKLKYFDGTNFGNVDEFIWITETIGTGDGTTTSFTYTTQEIPITPNSITVTYTIGGTQYQAQDDGKGNITDTNLTGTVNYQTGEITLTFNTAPDNSTDITITYSCSDVLNVMAEDIEFKDEKLYVSYGTDVYISEVRDPSRWIFISVNKQDGANITGIKTYYDKLVIFKGEPRPAIYVLSGYSLDTYRVLRVSEHISTDDRRATVQHEGELYFLWKGRVYALSRVMRYGDVEPEPLNLDFDPLGEGYRFALPIPSEGVIFFVGERVSSFSHTPSLGNTFLSFQPKLSHGIVVNDKVYLCGGEKVYEYDENSNLDDGTKVFYQVDFANFGSPAMWILGKRYFLNVFPFQDGEIYLYNGSKLVANFQGQKPSLWDNAQWDNAVWGADYTKPLAKRQVIHDRFLKLSLKTQILCEIFSLIVELGARYG